ncbi:MAG: transporter substrate-binding domain-containing protein, partial [Clostridia bacterium]|nr:transporter substrate-binding domain-containing protein [Clostridia bacterium]
ILSRQKTDAEIDILSCTQITECFDALEQGNADAVYVDSIVAGYYLSGENTDFKQTWTSGEIEPIGVCLKKGNDELTDIVNTAIDVLYMNGTMAELSEKHFGSVENVDGLRIFDGEPTLDLSALKTIEDGKLRVGMMTGYPPMEYTGASGELTGFDVELAYAIGELLGLEVELVSTAWDGIFTGLDNEEYDVIISSVSITDEREESYNFTEPYVSNALCIVVHEDK